MCPYGHKVHSRRGLTICDAYRKSRTPRRVHMVAFISAVAHLEAPATGSATQAPRGLNVPSDDPASGRALTDHVCGTPRPHLHRSTRYV